ncbi:hypothetical protein OPV22_032098 [Ensete ventricosum]|uniref:Uncharacterized protein n=1 Tax=Ensete ventricosum TaxID=4639 RepID=A0AAV8PUH2_ENSVE|nr:hypothetical protein OPV22_032098 [Ensete ventricosum]
MGSMAKNDGTRPREHAGAGPGKIFVDGLHRDTTYGNFQVRNFSTYAQCKILSWNIHEVSQHDLLSKGNMIDLAGSKVEIKKAEPKKVSNQPASYGREPLAWSFGDSFGGGGYGPGPYRIPGGFGGSSGGYGVGAGEFGGGFDRGLGGILGESSLGYSSRLGSYG